MNYEQMFAEQFGYLHKGSPVVARLAAAMMKGERVSPLDALRCWRCMRLGARVHELRVAGWPVETEVVNRRKKRYAIYYLPEVVQ